MTTEQQVNRHAEKWGGGAKINLSQKLVREGGQRILPQKS